MTTPIDLVDLLRRAADVVEENAKGASLAPTLFEITVQPIPSGPVARAVYLAECGCTVEALTPIDLVEVADEHRHDCGMSEKTS